MATQCCRSQNGVQTLDWKPVAPPSVVRNQKCLLRPTAAASFRAPAQQASLRQSHALACPGSLMSPSQYLNGRAAMPDPLIASWMVWALLSAAFAALTAIFAKVGVEQINSDLATFIRTVVILVCPRRHSACARPLAVARQHLRQNLSISHIVRTGHGRILALLFPRPSTR
jgi:hypothetical protein